MRNSATDHFSSSPTNGKTERRRDGGTEGRRDREKVLSLSLSVSPSLCLSVLEVELQRELNLSRRERAADLAETAAAPVGIGRAEVGFVEEVEEFGSELQPSRFGYRQCEVLLQTEIELIKGVAARDVAPGGAEGLINTRNRDIWNDEVIINRARSFWRKNRARSEERRV